MCGNAISRVELLEEDRAQQSFARSLADGVVMVDAFWEIFHVGIHTFSTRGGCAGVGDEKA